MKLKFSNVNKSYNGFEGYVPVQAGGGWVGIADVEDSFGKELVKEAGVEEITPEVFDWFKKKLLAEPVTYRNLSTIRQDADRNPIAEYVEEVRHAPSESPSPKDPKDIVKVESVEAEVVEESVEVKPKSRSKKRSK